jgi:ribonuclease R
MVTEAQVLKLVRGRHYGPVTAEEMAGRLNVPPEEEAAFHELIEELKLAGEIVDVKKKRLADPERVELVVGTLLCNPRGFGFIRPVRERDGEDLHVSGENMSSAFHGDTVVARVPPALRGLTREDRISRGRGRRGDQQVKIVEVLKRARTEVVGTLRVEGSAHYLIPDDPRLFRDIFIPAENVGKAKHDDKVAAKISVWPTRHINPVGVITEVFGRRGEMEAERLSVAHAFGLNLEFPPAVLRAAKRMPDAVQPKDMEGRSDLTGDFIFTVDPADARDFDDAVSIKRLPDGGWNLGVHIADVSHYVLPDKEIDIEARRRGTSVYLPGQVLPMLPESLSNGLCSLRPREVRLTKTACMDFDADGNLLRTRVFNSVIRSVQRFTYEEVQKVIDGEDLGPDGEKLVWTILRMNELAELLRSRRRDVGMIELEIPEPHILTDDKGRTVGVELRKGDPSHRLIEQFMLAANEAVANYLLQHNLPYIGRVHDEPDPESIQEYRETARALGHNFPSPGTRAQLQKFLDRMSGTPEAPILSYLLLRSFKIARYEAEDRPHYALAIPHYLHFTSPIRRYPDLLVHRILDEHWSGKMKEAGRRDDYWRQNMAAWAQQATDAERNADEAERMINDRRLMDFVASRKEPMSALITGVGNFGLRVQLREFMLDGVVRISALGDAYFRVDRKRAALTGPRGQEYRIGQTIAVRVAGYDEFKHQIEFEPHGKPGRSRR